MMKMKTARYILGCIFALFFLIIQDAKAQAIDKIIVFGDSLSDNGNLFALTSGAHKYIPFVPIIPKAPYYEGRFTNGRVWVEAVAESLNVPLLNYAYGGSWVETVVDSHMLMPFDVNMQVNIYLVSAVNDYDIDKHLFVIWAGGNDYTQGRSDVDYATTNTVSIIEKQIDWLVYYGAKNFFIATLPDLSKTPAAMERGPDFAAHIDKLVSTHNAKLIEMIKAEQKKRPDVKLIIGDVNDSMGDVIKHPDKYNLKNTTEGCYKGDYSLLATTLVSEKEMNAAKKAKLDILNNTSLKVAYLTSKMAGFNMPHCTNPEEYLFWDHIHPTAIIHQIIATVTLDELHDNGVTGQTS